MSNEYHNQVARRMHHEGATGFYISDTGGISGPLDADTLHTIVALDERLYYGHAGLGLAAMGDENFAVAEQHLKTAAALEPEDASVATNLGEALLRLDRLEDAIRELTRAAGIDSTGRDPGAARARAILQGIAQGVAGQTQASGDGKAGGKTGGTTGGKK